MNNPRTDKIVFQIHLPSRELLIRALKFAGLASITAISAIVIKETQATQELPSLVQISQVSTASMGNAGNQAGVQGSAAENSQVQTENVWINDPNIRYFNGRPVRPMRTISMVVTAYSPDAISCPDSDDGITASCHNVETNDGALVAADTSILPLGSLVSVPGYDEGNIVPVLDRGGAIKGKRLDVLYPTHKKALKWGVQNLEVTVWEYADGLPPDDYRKERGAKRKWN